MRLKNIPGAKEKVESSKYVVLEPEQHKNKYSEIFGNNNPICLEIGMGKGNFIIGMAQMYPNINFIGMEKYDSVIVKAVEKLEELELPNLRIIRYDATDIEKVFGKEIDTIYLNFSDPWPKNRHENRRLSSKLFLQRYDKLFIGQPKIQMKTDNRKLFEFSIMSFTSYGYTIDSISLDLYNDDLKGNVATEYEQKFVAKGNPIYKIVVNK